MQADSLVRFLLWCILVDMKRLRLDRNGQSSLGFGIILLVSALGIVFISITASFVVFNRVRADHQPYPTPVNSTIVAQQLMSSRQASKILLGQITPPTLSAMSTADYNGCVRGHTPFIGIAGSSQDSFRFRCQARMTEFYGFNGNFHDTLLQLHQVLMSLGWQPRDTASLDWVAHNYTGHDPNYNDSLAAHPRGVNASALPASIEGYSKQGFTIDVNYGAINGGFKQLVLAETESYGYPYYHSEQLVSEAKLNAASTNFRYIVGLSLTKTYYLVNR